MNQYSHKNPKIDIYVAGVYQCSTNWSKTCKDAVKDYQLANPVKTGITARRAKSC